MCLGLGDNPGWLRYTEDSKHPRSNSVTPVRQAFQPGQRSEKGVRLGCGKRVRPGAGTFLNREALPPRQSIRQGRYLRDATTPAGLRKTPPRGAKRGHYSPFWRAAILGLSD